MEKSIHSQRYRRLIIELQTHRKLAKIPQHELALKLGTTQSQISKIERLERRLDVLELIDYCRAINLKPEDISDLIIRISAMKADDIR
jgi:transcriptional regulator with XRE-family HTH domain